MFGEGQMVEFSRPKIFVHNKITQPQVPGDGLVSPQAFFPITVFGKKCMKRWEPDKA